MYVHESRKRVVGVPANLRVLAAKPVPGGRLPPAQVKAYVYGATPPDAAGSAWSWKVPTTRLCLTGDAKDRGVTPPVTSTSTARETVSAGWALSVTVYVHESRKRVVGVPANLRVLAAKPVPGGRLPPAQVKGVRVRRDAARRRRKCLVVEGPDHEALLDWRRQGQGVTPPVTSTSTAREPVSAGWALSVTVYVHESRKRVVGVPANLRVLAAKPSPAAGCHRRR